jgi:hypothetical protein
VWRIVRLWVHSLRSQHWKDGCALGTAGGAWSCAHFKYRTALPQVLRGESLFAIVSQLLFVLCKGAAYRKTRLPSSWVHHYDWFLSFSFTVRRFMSHCVLAFYVCGKDTHTDSDQEKNEILSWGIILVPWRSWWIQALVIRCLARNYKKLDYQVPNPTSLKSTWWQRYWLMSSYILMYSMDSSMVTSRINDSELEIPNSKSKNENLGLKLASLPSQSRLILSPWFVARTNACAAILVSAHLTMRADCSSRLIP